MTNHLDGAQRRTAVIEALGILGAGPEERFDRITRMTHEAFGVPLTFLNLVHHGLVTTQSTFGWHQGTSVPASEQFCATTVLSSEPMVIPDTALDPRFAHTAAVAEHGIRFYAGAPLTMLDGTRVGTLCVMDAQPRTFSAEDTDLLRDLAHWAQRELGRSIEEDRVRRVVGGLVPDPVAVRGWDLDVLSMPSVAAGDVADWRVAADGRLHLTVGAVPAAGSAGALLAASVRAAVIARTDVPMAAAFPALEAQIAADLSAAGTVGSLFHLRVDPSTGYVEYTDAGHGLAVLLGADGGTEVLRSSELPLGLQPAGASRTPGALTLASGDRVVLCSDGVLAGTGGFDELVDAARATGDGAALVDRVRASATHGTLLVLSRH